MSVEQIKKKVLPILRRHGVSRAGIFGSVARGQANLKSDIDILVSLKKGSSLLDLVGLEFELKKKLNRRVDLITYKSLDHKLKQRILAEEKPIL